MLKITEPSLCNDSIARINYFNKRNETFMIIKHINKVCSTGRQVPFYLYGQGRPLTLNVPVVTNQTCTKTL